MNSDFLDLLVRFNAGGVKYVVVGGYAVIRYTQPRYTGAIDILIEACAENGLRAFNALRDFGAPVGTLTSKDFSEPGYFFQMGIPPNRIDLLMSIAGVDFATCWKRREAVVIGGQTVPFISKADLIAAKRAAGRPKDLADLEMLERPN